MTTSPSRDESHPAQRCQHARGEAEKAESPPNSPGRTSGIAGRHELLSAVRETNERQPDVSVALGMLGIDNMRAIVEIFGHDVRDRLLDSAVDRLAVSQSCDCIARVADADIAFLVEADVQNALALAQSIRSVASAPFEIEGRTVHVEWSCGIAARQSVETAATLFDRTDAALRASQTSGKPVVLHDAELEQSFRRSRAIRTALGDCDLRSELSIVLQPLCDLSTGRALRAEALARWSSPSLGPVRPDAFIAAAEQSGLIHSVTLVLLEKTLEELLHLPEEISVSFNLSSHDIADPKTVLAIVALVRRMGVDAERIIFEITETAALRSFEAAEDALRLFRSMGVRVSLDDFGAGYSGLDYLHRLTFDEIKIDKSFLLHANAAKKANMLKAIASLCDGLQLPYVIEGVETQEHLSLVESIGPRSYQGYLFARPMPPEEFRTWLQTSDRGTPREASEQTRRARSC